LWEAKISSTRGTQGILWRKERWEGRFYQLKSIPLGCLLGEQVAIVGWRRICWRGVCRWGHWCRVMWWWRRLVRVCRWMGRVCGWWWWRICWDWERAVLWGWWVVWWCSVLLDWLLFLFLWLEAPLGQKWSRHFPRVLKSGVAYLPWHLLAYFLRGQLGHQAVHLLAHLLWLEVAHFFGRVYPDIHGLIVAHWLARDKLTVVWSTCFEWDSLTCCIRELFIHGLGHCSALIDRFVIAHALLPVSFLDIFANLFVHFVAFFNILHHRGVLILGHTGCLVLGLAHLVGNLAVFRR